MKMIIRVLKPFLVKEAALIISFQLSGLAICPSVNLAALQKLKNSHLGIFIQLGRTDVDRKPELRVVLQGQEVDSGQDLSLSLRLVSGAKSGLDEREGLVQLDVPLGVVVNPDDSSVPDLVVSLELWRDDALAAADETPQNVATFEM